jgi:Putative beta barrel porin-7 (BBP7)
VPPVSGPSDGACACVDCSEFMCPAPAGGGVWFSADFLLWWIKGGNVPPLVTTSPPASTGTLGQPGTVVLFGPGSDLEQSPTLGGRFTAGYWFNEDHRFGLEGSYFFLAPRGHHFDAGGDGSPGSPVIARPFFNTITGKEDSELVNFPGVVAGHISVDPSSTLQGFEANVVYNLCCSCNCCVGALCFFPGTMCEFTTNATEYNWRVSALAGFRYLDLDESLGISENLAVLPSVPQLGGSQFVILDSFSTHNQFYGGQVGLRGEMCLGRLFAVGSAKVALGDCQQSVDIRGFTQITTPAGAVSTQPGGLLALPSNSGHFFGEHFAVVPDVSLTVGYQVTEHLSITFGYNFLYWSNVARPGDQIDRNINPLALPTNGSSGVPANRPAFSLQDTDFWAQGLTFGTQLRF